MGKESFSKIIMRIMEGKKQRPLTDFFGTLSDESVHSIEKAINEGRKKHLDLRIIFNIFILFFSCVLHVLP